MESDATQLAQTHQPERQQAEMQQAEMQQAEMQHGGRQFSAAERIGLFCLAIVLLGLLIVAAWLAPNPAGLGTHTQLGLPGCTMYTLMRIRCPGCGMTTSWAHAMNGDLRSALESNVGGLLLCLLSEAVFPCLFWMAIRGKSIPGEWFSRVAVITLLIAIAISIAEWLIRLAF